MWRIWMCKLGWHCWHLKPRGDSWLYKPRWIYWCQFANAKLVHRFRYECCLCDKEKTKDR